MRIEQAALAASGAETLIEFAEQPELIGQDDLALQQVYLPGVWVPGHPGLEEPFKVPILGDNESTSLTIDWPVNATAPYHKRIALTAMLPAEDFIRGEPLDLETAEVSEMDEFDARHAPLNEVLDEYIGEWGGFLYAAVHLEPVSIDTHATAQFILFESDDDFEATIKLLKTGLISAAEIVGITRIQALLGKPAEVLLPAIKALPSE